MSAFQFHFSNIKSKNGERARFGRGWARGRVEPKTASLARLENRRVQISALAEGRRVVGAVACARGGRAPHRLLCSFGLARKLAIASIMLQWKVVV